jgi:hypothetical protein
VASVPDGLVRAGAGAALDRKLPAVSAGKSAKRKTSAWERTLSDQSPGDLQKLDRTVHMRSPEPTHVSEPSCSGSPG